VGANEVGPPNLGGPPPPGTGTGGGGFNWDPVSWIASTVDGTAHDVDTSITWAGSYIGKAAHWTAAQIAKIPHDVATFVEDGLKGIHDIIFRVTGLLHHLISIGFAHLHQVEGWAQDALGAFHHIVTWTVEQVGSMIKDFQKDVIDPTIHDIDVQIDGIKAQIKHRLDPLAALIAEVEHDVLAALDVTIKDVESTLKGWATGAISDFERDVVDPIISDVDALKKTVAGLADAVGADVIDAVNLVKDAADWLELAATYTLDVVEGEPAKLLSGLTLSGLRSKAKGLPDESTSLTKQINDFLDS
jgi:hypothetical protein